MKNDEAKVENISINHPDSQDSPDSLDFPNSPNSSGFSSKDSNQISSQSEPPVLVDDQQLIDNIHHHKPKLGPSLTVMKDRKRANKHHYSADDAIQFSTNSLVEEYIKKEKSDQTPIWELETSYSYPQQLGQALLKPIEVLSLPSVFRYLPNELSLINKITIEIAANAAYAAFVDVRDAVLHKQNPLSGVRAEGGGNVGLGFLKLSISKSLSVGFVCLANYGIAKLLITFPVESLDETFRQFLNNDHLRTPAFTGASFIMFKSSEWIFNRLLNFSVVKNERIHSEYHLSLPQKVAKEVFRLGDDILLAGSILMYTNAYGYSILTNNPLLAMAIVKFGDIALETIRYFSYTPHPIDHLQPKQPCFKQDEENPEAEPLADWEVKDDQDVVEDNKSFCTTKAKNLTMAVTMKLGWQGLATGAIIYFGTLDACDEFKLEGCGDDYSLTWGKILGIALLLEFGKNNVPSCETIKKTAKQTWNVVTTPFSKFYGAMFNTPNGMDTPLIPDNGIDQAPNTVKYGSIN